MERALSVGIRDIALPAIDFDSLQGISALHHPTVRFHAMAGIHPCDVPAEPLDVPVCCGYQHNDAFPGSHPLAAGPLGYNGSKAAMELIAKADVVLALGTRLNPFSTLPSYGIDYWPKDAKLIQVDINADRIGLTKKVTVPR